MAKKQKAIECPLCGGKGKHSLAIDGQGLSADDFDDWGDQEFEDYKSGAWDKVCEGCKGNGKVVRGSEAHRLALDQAKRYSMSDEQLLRYDY